MRLSVWGSQYEALGLRFSLGVRHSTFGTRCVALSVLQCADLSVWGSQCTTAFRNERVKLFRYKAIVASCTPQRVAFEGSSSARVSRRPVSKPRALSALTVRTVNNVIKRSRLVLLRNHLRRLAACTAVAMPESAKRMKTLHWRTRRDRGENALEPVVWFGYQTTELQTRE